MLDKISDLLGFADSLTGLFAFIPAPMLAVLIGAVSVIFVWFFITVIKNILEIFF